MHHLETWKIVLFVGSWTALLFFASYQFGRAQEVYERRREAQKFFDRVAAELEASSESREEIIDREIKKYFGQD